ncbi:MAG TPA: excinuclease ABC subunit UvrA [Proteobacteria bacterium]|nr:excinuclease ABC subunit UvrA [Pseudomonadota bacterium]
MASENIVIRGAKQHNLKNIDVTIPRHKLTVITGLSGSGKSTLAFDTIYAEGQRRYVESLSAYARQFLEQMDKPDVEFIEGLSPAIAIEQKTLSKNPRSTVGTVTEIYDYLRLLFARIGRPFCYQCGREIQTQTIDQMVDAVMRLAEGSRIIIMAPIVVQKKGEHQNVWQRLRKEGFIRARVDGQILSLEESPILDKHKRHTIEAVIDRLIIRPGLERRLADSIGLATILSDGIALVQVNEEEEIFFSQKQACIYCGISLPELTPQLFSFNNPRGACPACDGLGTHQFFDPDLIIPNPNLSLREGAIAPWAHRHGVYFIQILESVSGHYHFDIHTPFKALPDQAKKVLLYGSNGEEILFSYDKDGRRHFYRQPFEGIIPQLERRYRETSSRSARGEIEQYMNEQPCPACKGARLRKEALSVRVGPWAIDQMVNLNIKTAIQIFERLPLTEKEFGIAMRILREINSRLSFLQEVGLDYLTLNRASATLSGGEGQRIRLATQIGSQMVGVIYVLDEPSIGLHQRDHARLLATLKRLRDMGNTVLVVEHDPETICSADYIIDMGPGAGQQGGEVVFAGTPAELLHAGASLTGQYLSGRQAIFIPARRRTLARGYITAVGASQNNLRNITVKIPLGQMVCVTGVSGSGKSTLVIDTLYKALAQMLYHSKERAGRVERIDGLQFIDKVSDLDQSPIGRTPRSNPATYTGLFAPIRDLFARTPEARARGYKAGRFSFNIKGGRCEACDGDGLIKIEMHFLPDVYVTCENCRGKRYNRETLEIRYKDKTIADVLDMTVDEAYLFFQHIPAIKARLKVLREVGLGYVHLGQSATTLSGGEAQRVKLARELSGRSTGRTLYILDEPTTGLHPADVHKLLEVLNRLVEAGNTVVIIEHNMDVIKTADYIIDLGPEGGDEGGRVVGSGTPEEISRLKRSYTGQFLRKVLASVR